MCIALLMRIEEIHDLEAVCSAKGVRRTVSLFMVQDLSPNVGDWVLVHVGYAMRTVSEKEARETWALFDELLVED